MSEQFWLSLLSALGTTNVVVLGLLIKALATWRKELKQDFERYCNQNAMEHKNVWTRVEHHMHAENGKVTITD